MSSLQDSLRHVLPRSIEFHLLHLLSPSRETHQVVLERYPGYGSQRVVKAQHFFALACESKVFYALEIYVYITLHNGEACDKLVFVSKADTNGYCDRAVSIKDVTRVLLEFVTSISPLEYLNRVIGLPASREANCDAITHHTTTKRALRILKSRHEHHEAYRPPLEDPYIHFNKISPQWTCKLSLFTRSEPQYLFAESSQNGNKHVLPGDKLLKWWLSVVDSIVTSSFDTDTNARLQIPGEEAAVTAKHIRELNGPDWQIGDIFNGVPEDLAIFKIPVFPDDPKGRFLEQLVDEGRARKVQLSQFWVELQVQQEFRLGDTVSVIGVAGKLRPLISQVVADTEVVLTSSRKMFNMIKSYVTGEEYDKEDGALDAYANVRDFLHLRLNRSYVRIIGTKAPKQTGKIFSNSDISHTSASAPKPQVRIQTLNTSIVRKKPKTT
ncbi:LAME_0C02784g1_1 [Lachancea meyersii CBS 8951]|uniref:histone acetyltransferase n=1 Tax=Lachancea meyersii CBS 8951 TaxID=1266667 RepID=A0A1G4IZZ8_9SACH|nr:LAME_0C02784g1_1 [Lachancea meyersii CBS 8951]